MEHESGGVIVACSCRNNQEEIETTRKAIWAFKKKFVRRLIRDSEHQDRRRKDFNQALFFKNHNGDFVQGWDKIDLNMVMDAFENAVRDTLRSYCDVEGCTRKRGK